MTDSAYRLLLIGPGGIGRVYRRLALAAGDRITGVISSRLASGARAAAEIAAESGGNTPRAYASVEEALARGHFDGAVLASPARTHLAALERLLPAPLAVLAEKPLTDPLDAQMPAADIVHQRWQAWRSKPFVFAAGNRYFLDQIDIKAPLAAPAIFHFRFHTQGPHIGPGIAADLLPHALSMLQHLDPAGGQTALAQMSASQVQLDIRSNRVRGHFPYGHWRVEVDLAEGAGRQKDLTFGFGNRLWQRRQSGNGSNYRVWLEGPATNPRRHNCTDPFATLYQQFRRAMHSQKSGGSAPSELDFALTNQALTAALLARAGACCDRLGDAHASVCL